MSYLMSNKETFALIYTSSFVLYSEGVLALSDAPTRKRGRANKEITSVVVGSTRYQTPFVI